MSYASGFMVGTSIGKAVYDLFHNKKGKAAAAAAPPVPSGLRSRRQREYRKCPVSPAYPS